MYITSSGFIISCSLLSMQATSHALLQDITAFHDKIVCMSKPIDCLCVFVALVNTAIRLFREHQHSMDTILIYIKANTKHTRSVKKQTVSLQNLVYILTHNVKATYTIVKKGMHNIQYVLHIKQHGIMERYTNLVLLLGLCVCIM